MEDELGGAKPLDGRKVMGFATLNPSYDCTNRGRTEKLCFAKETSMGRPQPIEYADAQPQVRAVFDDIKKTRDVPDVNNFWKHLAADPALLARTWEGVKQAMSPGTLDALTKEMIYVAVSVTNGWSYCIASHTAGARKAGMTEQMFG